MGREGCIERKTKETEVYVRIDLEGKGESSINTSIPFLDHMLTLMAAHSRVDLEIRAVGDREVDDHHTVEDVGISLGMALKQALGDWRGIRRYGEATIPMDEALARVVLDISNRPILLYRVALKKSMIRTFDVGLVQEFFRGLVTHAGITAHMDLLAGEEPHHISEAIFKAFARALDQSVRLDPRLGDEIPSTKGLL